MEKTYRSSVLTVEQRAAYWAGIKEAKRKRIYEQMALPWEEKIRQIIRQQHEDYVPGVTKLKPWDALENL